MPSPDAKRNRILPYHKRQHTLRPVPYPQSSRVTVSIVEPIPQAETFITNAPTPACPKHTKPFPFFDLPGEIRNRIYDLVIPEVRVVMSGSHPQKELRLMKEREPEKKHKAPRYRLHGEFSTEPTEASLLFTCRQMNHESIRYIYARTMFCFKSFVVLRKFLTATPEAARVSIASMDITHVGYSEPAMLADREWKKRHDTRWAAVLRQVKERTSLRRLALDVTNFDWPIRLELTESWARPLLDLAGDGLDRVDLMLEQDRFPVVKCEVVGKELENRMMTACGRKAKRREERITAAEERKRIEDSKRKATKVLTISLPNGAPKVTGPAKKFVKNKGLENYAVAQPLVAFC